MYRIVRIRWFGTVAAFVTMLFPASPLAAQSLEWGVKGGSSFANLRGDDVEPQETSGLAGFTGGTFFTVRFTDMFALQPEVNFTRKGTQLDFTDEDGRFSGALQLDYVEVPLFIKVVAPVLARTGIHFAGLAGPVVAFKTDCDVVTDVPGGTMSTECGTADLPIRKRDFGVALGAGLGVPVGQARLWLEGRYTIGLTTIDDTDDDDDVRNYNFAVTAGLSVPVWTGRRVLATARR